ncbi:MAG: hypothetical protein ACKE51_06710 [Methylococcaceae bacterium]
MSKKIIVVLLNILLVACTTSSKNPDGFLMVDCLLPGDVKHLGEAAIYITARKAIQATVSDCAGWGGEYSPPSRPNLAQALQFWLPAAEGGDQDAQNHIAELYEKGLDLTPDYQRAAIWYLQAARQGHSQAQINLGNLYARGLGVSKNKATADQWYKKAAGLTQTGLPYATVMNNQSSTQSDEQLLLHNALQQSQLESSELKKRLKQAQQQLQQAQHEIDKSETLIAQSQLKLSSNAAQLSQQEQQQLHSVIANQQQVINKQSSNLQSIESQYQNTETRLTTQLAQTKRRAEILADDLQRHQTKSNQMASKLLLVQAQLAKTEQQLLQKQQPDTRINELLEKKQTLATEINRLQKQVTNEISAEKPSIEIIDPSVVVTSNQSIAALSTSVSEREIVGKIAKPKALLSLSVNDQNVKVNPQGVFRSMVNLSSPKTQVKIVAISQQGVKSKLDFTISTQSTIADTNHENWRNLNFGQYHALIIGNQSYQKIQSLNTPAHDIKVINSILQNKYGFKTTVLLDKNRDEILTALHELKVSLSENDNLLIYYAGHGEYDRINMRGHWLPRDADPPENTTRWISTVAITDILHSMKKVKHILVVSDSCYSGSMARGVTLVNAPESSGKQKLQWLEEMLARDSRTVLTSGDLEPVMDGGGGEHSVFAGAFIKALRKNAGLMAGQALHRQIRKGIVATAAEYGHTQVPVYGPIQFSGHDSGEFFFVPRH